MLTVTTLLVSVMLGVITRAFGEPLIWTDELASILFLWLAMLGSVIALQRTEHMRLTAVIGGMSPSARARTEALASAAVAGFLLMIVPSAWDYASDQWFIETPALGIHDTFRAMAILVGAVLMVVTAVTRLLRLSWADALFGVLIVLALATALHFGAPWLKGFGNWNLVLFFVLLLGAGVLLSVPIGFAFGLATLAYLATLTRTPLTVVVSRMDEGMSSLILLAVPLFVFLGLLIEMTGMARAMVNFLSSLLGHVRGGLSYVLLGAMYLVSGISGSKAADMAAVAPVLFPDMKRRGFNEGELVSLLAASGAMSETIPPSLVLITIGSVTGVSIAALFTGGGVHRPLARPQRKHGRRHPPALGHYRPRLHHLAARAGAAVRHPHRGDRGHRHRDRGLHHRHRVCGDRRHRDLPAVSVAADISDVAGNRGAVGRDPADHRHRDRDGVGADAVGLFAPACGGDGICARRGDRVHGDLDRRVHRARQRAGGHPGDRAVRPAAVSHRQAGGHP